MDQKNSERFSEALQLTGYQISKSERESIKSLDHLEELKHVMDWFADFINSDHSITKDELRMFEELEDEGEMLYGEDLGNALDEFFEDNSKSFDDVVNVLDFEFMKEESIESETVLEHLKSLRSFIGTKLQHAKENASALEVEKKTVSKELSEIITSLLELNSSINVMLNTLCKTWDELKEPLMHFDQNDPSGRFMYKQSFSKYINVSSKFENNLAHYFKFKFNDRAKLDVDTTVLKTFLNESTAVPLNEAVTCSNLGKTFPQIKCKKLVRELECVQEHIKTNREEKTLALADEKAYSLALEQMNTLIESFNHGLKVSISDVRFQSIENSEGLAEEEEKLCALTESLTLNSEILSVSESMKAVSGDEFSKLKRQEDKLHNLSRLQYFIEKRLHCDEYLVLFLEAELLKVEAMIEFMENIVKVASNEWEDIQNNREVLVVQEDFLKKQAVQLCKGHPLIKTLNALYKLKAEDLDDITNLVHTIEVQNKIITDVSYQLAHLYNLRGNDGMDSMTYMRELTNNIFSGKARQSVSNINKSMIPVKPVEKQIDDLKGLFKLQKCRFEEHIEYLTRKPSFKVEQSLWSLFLVRPLQFKQLVNEAEKKLKNRKTKLNALTYKA